MATLQNPQNRVLEKFIGKGISFPIELDNKGRPVIKTGFALIRDSIFTLLAWPNATRMFLENFGSRLEDLLEEPNTTIFDNLAVTFIKDSIERYERRIQLLDVTVVNRNNDKIFIQLDYRIINSGLEDGFIYPFYKPLQ